MYNKYNKIKIHISFSILRCIYFIDIMYLIYLKHLINKARSKTHFRLKMSILRQKIAHQRTFALRFFSNYRFREVSDTSG